MRLAARSRSSVRLAAHSASAGDALARLDASGTVAARPEVTSLPMGSGAAVRPPWWLKPANKLFIRMARLGLRFGGEGPVVLTVAGRKSGKPRSTPVTPMTVDGKQYIVGGFPRADWVANVRAASEVTVARGRRSERVRPVELLPDDARPLLRVWPIQVPTGVSFMKRSGLVTEGRPEEFEALAGICPVFRLDPV